MKISFFTTLLAAVALAFGVAACDSASGLDTASNSEALQALAADLGLSVADVADISASFSSVDPETGEIRDPGELWRLAAQLHSTMSDEQIERLMQRAAEARMQRPGMHPGQQGQRPGMRPGQGLDLTDEQNAVIQAEREARRAEVEAVRNEVLGLTAEQLAGLAELEAARDAFRESQQAARDGGASQDELRAAAEAFHAQQKEAMTALLAETQHEIMAVHRFLSQRAGPGGPGGSGGPGGPGGHGPNGRPGQNG